MRTRILRLAFFVFFSSVHATDIRINLPVRINEQEMNFAFDTGAPGIMLFRHAANRLGLKLTPPPSDAKAGPGEVLFHLTEPVTFALDQHKIPNLPIMVVDGRPGPDDTIDGLVGWPNLRSNVIAFHGDEMQMRLIPKLPPEVATWLRLPIKSDWNILALQLPQMPAGQPVFLGVDTGSYHGVRLAPEAWRAFRAAHAGVPASLEAYFTPGAGFVVAEEIWAGEIDVAGLKLTGVPVAPMNRAEQLLFPPGTIAVLGISGLRRLDLILDEGRAALANPLRSPAPAYVHNRLGGVFVPTDSARDDDLIAHVVPGGPAAKAGVRAGDVLLKIDNLDVTPWRTAPGILPLGRFFEQAPGTKLQLTLRRGQKVVVCKATLQEIHQPRRK